ncbi:MAG: hypothetical protein DSY32_03710, partial [Aquifex sp.]
SIECLAAFYLSGYVPKKEVLAMWVSDYKNKKLIRAETAYYLVSPNIRSPMGLNIAAFEKKEDLEDAVKIFRGKVLTWQGVLDYVAKKWKDKIKK